MSAGACLPCQREDTSRPRPRAGGWALAAAVAMAALVDVADGACDPMDFVLQNTDCKCDYLLKPSAEYIQPSFAVLNEVTSFKLGGGSPNYFVTFVKSKAEEAGSGENGTDHGVTSIDCYNMSGVVNSTVPAMTTEGLQKNGMALGYRFKSVGTYVVCYARNATGPWNVQTNRSSECSSPLTVTVRETKIQGVHTMRWVFLTALLFYMPFFLLGIYFIWRAQPSNANGGVRRRSTVGEASVGLGGGGK